MGECLAWGWTQMNGLRGKNGDYIKQEAYYFDYY